MLENGIPSQDARGILPHHILTNMFWCMSLKTLMHIWNTRWCCQAQTTEWIPFLKQVKHQLLLKLEPLTPFLNAPIDRGEPCGFNASFDRPCTWKEGQPV
jgi:hypothetical protein